LKRNGAETENPEYEISGIDVNPEQNTKLEILCNYPTKIKLTKILREKLGLSSKVFGEMLDNGYIRLNDGTDIRKAKLRHDYVVIINTKVRD